jgi:hypothetical protein
MNKEKIVRAIEEICRQTTIISNEFNKSTHEKIIFKALEAENKFIELLKLII